MKKNTVTLCIKEYNSLFLMKRSIDDRKKLFVRHNLFNEKQVDYILASEEDSKLLFLKENEVLNKKIMELRSEISYIKGLNWFEFRKWKKNRF